MESAIIKSEIFIDESQRNHYGISIGIGYRLRISIALLVRSFDLSTRLIDRNSLKRADSERDSSRV